MVNNNYLPVEMLYLVEKLYRGLYQGALIMTHRDGFSRLSARSAWRGDAWTSGAMRPVSKPWAARKPWETAVPVAQANRQRANRWGRRKALTMSRRTRGFPPTRPLARRIACAISMGHYQRSLVFGAPKLIRGLRAAMPGFQAGPGARAPARLSPSPIDPCQFSSRPTLVA